MIVFGGHGHGKESNDFFHINTSSFESTNIAPLERSSFLSRIGHSANTVGNHMYVFGGWDGSKYANHGFLYSSESLNLTIEKNRDRTVPSERRDHSMTFLDNKLYLFGGWNCTDQFNDVWILDDGWNWSQSSVKGDLPIPRRGHSAAAVGHSIYVFGGIYGFSRFLNDLYVLDTNEMKWSSPETTGDKPSPRAWHSACTIGKFIVVFGGTAGRYDFFNDVFVLDTEALHWHHIDFIGEQPAPRCSHSAVVHGSDIIIFGGIASLPASMEKKIIPLADIHVLQTNMEI